MLPALRRWAQAEAGTGNWYAHSASRLVVGRRTERAHRSAEARGKCVRLRAALGERGGWRLCVSVAVSVCL